MDLDRNFDFELGIALLFVSFLLGLAFYFLYNTKDLLKLVLLFGLIDTYIVVRLIYYFFWQLRKAKLNLPIVHRYSPPENISPIQAAFLLRGTIDEVDILAEVIYLNLLNYLKISCLDHKCQLKKLKTPDALLEKYQEEILNDIFAEERTKENNIIVHFWNQDIFILLGLKKNKKEHEPEEKREIPLSEALNKLERKSWILERKVKKSLIEKGLVSRYRSWLIDVFLNKAVGRDKDRLIASIQEVIEAISLIFFMLIFVYLAAPAANRPKMFSGIILSMSGFLVFLIIGIEALLSNGLPVWNKRGKKVVEHLLGYKKFIKKAELQRILWFLNVYKLENPNSEELKKIKLLLAYTLALRVSNKLVVQLLKITGLIKDRDEDTDFFVEWFNRKNWEGILPSI